MKEQQESISRDVEINLGEYFAVLRPYWLKIFVISFAIGVITLLLLFLKPNLYRSTAIVTPADLEGNRNQAFFELAPFGIPIGGPTKVEDLETLFKSNDLTVRVFHHYNLWTIVFPKDFDSKNGKLKVGWLDRLQGEKEEHRELTDWDAIRAAEDRYMVYVNVKARTLSISFESSSPEGSAAIVKYYLEEGKSRLQEEALERATKNKKFIEKQIGKTVDALTRDRMYALFGQEVEREMLARNREQFGFRVIDSPRVPDKKSNPKRSIIALFAAVFSFIVCSLIFVVIGTSRKNTPNVDGTHATRKY